MFVYDPPTSQDRRFQASHRRRGRLVLPDRRPEVEPERTARRDATAEPLTILMAASYWSVVQIYRPYLLKNGVEIRDAHTGIECVAKLRQSPPDVLLLDSDIRWGQADGVVAVMRELSLLSIVPVLVVATRVSPTVHPVLFTVPGYHHRLPSHQALLRSLHALARCQRSRRAAS